jgi:hypothetical protein
MLHALSNIHSNGWAIERIINEVESIAEYMVG